MPLKWKLMAIAVALIAIVLLSLYVLYSPKESVGQEQAKAAIEAKQETALEYVKKETPNDPDVEIEIPKQAIKISVNGQEQTFKKDDLEKYVFDKNKLKLTQTSKMTLDIKVKEKPALVAGFDFNGRPMIGASIPLGSGKLILTNRAVVYSF